MANKNKKNVSALGDEAMGNVSGGNRGGGKVYWDQKSPVIPNMDYGIRYNTGRQKKITPDILANWKNTQEGK